MCDKPNWEEARMHFGPSLPLPELQFLSLAANKVAEHSVTNFFFETSVSLLFCPQISQEEALLAVAVFPAIRELDICSNPLITQRLSNSNGVLFFSFFSSPVSSVTSLMSPAEDAPSLTQYLQHRLGITVKSSLQPVTNLPLRQSDDPKRKVGLVSHYPPEFTKSQMVYLTDLPFYFCLCHVSVEGCISSSSGW